MRFFWKKYGYGNPLSLFARADSRLDGKGAACPPGPAHRQPRGKAMKRMLIAIVCLIVLSPLYAGASLFGSDAPKGTDEITPLQYASLLGLRDIDPALFRNKLLPLIEEAMKDGKITVEECRNIEKAAGNVAPAFLAAAKAPRLQDSISETLDKAKAGGKDLGSKLEDTLNNQLPQLLDDAMNLFREQMRQYDKETPQAPTSL